MASDDLANAVQEFQQSYNAVEKDKIWDEQSKRFRDFWKERVRGSDSSPISDSDCDKIISILDRNGKGNTKSSEAVAKAMIAQGAWRRMLNEFHSDKTLGSLVDSILVEVAPKKKAPLIDDLYKQNEGRGNFVTGPSGNAVNALLAAYDPFNNSSMISLKDRFDVLRYLKIDIPSALETASIGQRIVVTNQLLLDGIHTLGVAGSARTASQFCYFPSMKALWKPGHTVKLADESISVTVPPSDELQESPKTAEEEVRQSMRIQGLLAKMGASMGFKIWLPKSDRGRVLKVWSANEGELLEQLPVNFNDTTMKTVEQIDVLWVKRRTIVRAFEVEHTTSIYSGLLRMADLVALQANIDMKLHIVAADAKREKVFQEIRRPVFSLMEPRPLPKICTFLSYESVKEISENKLLAHLSDNVIDDYEESADEE